MDEAAVVCPACGEPRQPSELVDGAMLRPSIVDRIRRDHPGWTPDQEVCARDVHRARIGHLEEMLDAERGELSDLDREVLDSLREGETLAEDVDAAVEQDLTLGERVADRVASFGGSWTFIASFFAVLAGWMLLNALLLTRHPFDPYPFILLNLVLSCLAAVQAPVIMMSQHRQEMKDRARSEQDYQVNLKAELEVRLLHDKLDHLVLHQIPRLLEIQQLQTDLLDELSPGPSPEVARGTAAPDDGGSAA